MSQSTSTEVAVFDPEQSNFPILFAQEGDGGIAQIIEDNFGDEGFRATDLDRVKIPSAGGAYWQLPDEPPTKEIEGVIVAKQKTRSFWVKQLGEGDDTNEPPDCSSHDAKVGEGVFGPGSEGNPSGLCEVCPMNQFGSASRGEGKACKESMNLYMLQQDSVLPTHIALPPTSLKDFRKYMTRLASKGIPYYGVVTKIGLRQEKGPAGDYSIAVPTRGELLAPAERAAARAYGETIRGTLRAGQLDREAASERTEITRSETHVPESSYAREAAADRDA